MHDYNDDRIFERACKGLIVEGNNVILIAEYECDDVIEGISIIGLKNRKGLNRRIFSSAEAFLKARKINADIYHFHDPDLIPWMFLLKLTGKKVVYDVHENYESRFNKSYFPLFLRKFMAKSYRKIENFFARRYAGISVVTESMKNLFLPYENPAAIIGNVVYIDRLKSLNIFPLKQSNYIIYTSGTNSSSRNCLQTIEALPFILQEVSNVVMKFAGRYYPEGYKNQMQEKAEILGVGKYVILEDMIPWEENFLRTATAHIGCVFYEDNLNNRVTLPNRLFEYMYCGVAVLGEDFPEVRKVLVSSNSGLCVNSSNPKDIAEKAIFILKDPMLMEKMGENGRKAVLNKYNFENALKELTLFYSQIAKSA